MTERDPQGETAPEADAYEQKRPLVDDDPTDDATRDPDEPDVPAAAFPPRMPIDADPADAYEQTQTVEYDEDDYR